MQNRTKTLGGKIKEQTRMNQKKSLRQKIANLRTRIQMSRRKSRPRELIKRLTPLLNRYVAIFFGFVLVYFILLLLLIHVERGAEGATIRTIGQAVWYSLATFTTVGYGDFFPVTPAGRAIASVFLIIGIGLLGFFVGFMVEFITRISPVIMLTMQADRPWYIFTDKTLNAALFAENLKRVRPNAMIIYAESSDNEKSDKDISVPWPAEELLERRGSLYDAHIMCMKDNDMDNFLDAVRLAENDVPIICFSNFTPAHHPMNINFFSLADCTARAFWQQYPVKKKDETIIIIGFGNAGSMMLDRALELNVLYEDQHISYHVFGDGSEYCRNRKLLPEVVSVNEESGLMDSVIFHGGLWNEDESLLETADRIVLCSDSEYENIKVLHTIQKFFAVRSELYIYNSNVRGIATSFGQARDMLTPAYVLHNRLTDMALCRHELFRFMMGDDIPMWEDLNSLTKDMNYIATDHISIKVRIVLGDEAPDESFDDLDPKLLRRAFAAFSDAPQEEKERLRRIEHRRILRYYKLHNFHFGDRVDDEKRIHPLVKPYEELSDTEKQAIDISWTLLQELAAHKEAKGR